MIVDLEMRSGVDMYLKWIRSERMIADKASRPDKDNWPELFEQECRNATTTFVRSGPVRIDPGKRVSLDWEDARRQYIRWLALFT